MLVAPANYYEGVRWMENLDSSDSQIREQAENHPPQSFSGNTDRHYSSPENNDDRFFLDASTPAKSLFAMPDMYHQTTPLFLENDEASKFLRDSSVALFPRGLLIPYSIKDPILKNRLLALLPESSNLLIIDEVDGKIKHKFVSGKGYQRENTIQVKRICYKNHIPFIQAKTCIEGGNCFLFKSNDQKKAIVGNHSVSLSMIALEEQGEYDGIDASKITEVSLEAIRMARNLDLYRIKRVRDYEKHLEFKKQEEEQKKKEEEQADWNYENASSGVFYQYTIPEKFAKVPLAEEEIAYRRTLVAPLTDAEKNQYFEAAKLVEAKLKLTKEIMAQELGVDLENIAFIPQREFHIDMEMFVTPEGSAILHDPGMVEEFLTEVRQKENLDQNTLALLERYAKNARKCAKKFEETRKKCLGLLSACHIDSKCLPAVFKASKFTSTLNYCNGIFMDKAIYIQAQFENDPPCQGTMRGNRLFITTGPSKKSEALVHEDFIRLFNHTFNHKYTLIGLQGMSEFVNKFHGGVHCLTMNASPLK